MTVGKLDGPRPSLNPRAVASLARDLLAAVESLARAKSQSPNPRVPSMDIGCTFPMRRRRKVVASQARADRASLVRVRSPSQSQSPGGDILDGVMAVVMVNGAILDGRHQSPRRRAVASLARDLESLAREKKKNQSPSILFGDIPAGEVTMDGTVDGPRPSLSQRAVASLARDRLVDLASLARVKKKSQSPSHGVTLDGATLDGRHQSPRRRRAVASLARDLRDLESLVRVKKKKNQSPSILFGAEKMNGTVDGAGRHLSPSPVASLARDRLVDLASQVREKSLSQSPSHGVTMDGTADGSPNGLVDGDGRHLSQNQSQVASLARVDETKHVFTMSRHTVSS
jgi:hypothetical protein